MISPHMIHNDVQFPPQMVFRILNMCDLVFVVVSVPRSVWVHASSYGFISGLVWVYFWGL